MMGTEMATAIRTLGAFRRGDRVTVTDGGKSYDMMVTREARRSDGAYGSPESTYVTASFGPGRYSLDVRASLVASGRQSIARAE